MSFKPPRILYSDEPLFFGGPLQGWRGFQSRTNKPHALFSLTVNHPVAIERRFPMAVRWRLKAFALGVKPGGRRQHCEGQS